MTAWRYEYELFFYQCVLTADHQAKFHDGTIFLPDPLTEIEHSLLSLNLIQHFSCISVLYCTVVHAEEKDETMQEVKSPKHSVRIKARGGDRNRNDYRKILSAQQQRNDPLSVISQSRTRAMKAYLDTGPEDL